MSEQREDKETTQEQVEPAQTSIQANVNDSRAKTSKIRKATNIILAVATVMFIFHLVADRFIPSTDLGRVRAFVVPISPQVSGEIIDILVTPNTLVKQGDLLAKIDPLDY